MSTGLLVSRQCARCGARKRAPTACMCGQPRLAPSARRSDGDAAWSLAHRVEALGDGAAVAAVMQSCEPHARACMAFSFGVWPDAAARVQEMSGTPPMLLYPDAAVAADAAAAFRAAGLVQDDRGEEEVRLLLSPQELPATALFLRGGRNVLVPASMHRSVAGYVAAIERACARRGFEHSAAGAPAKEVADVKELEQLLKLEGAEKIAVMFHASWCPACKRFRASAWGTAGEPLPTADRLRRGGVEPYEMLTSSPEQSAPNEDRLQAALAALAGRLVATDLGSGVPCTLLLARGRDGVVRADGIVGGLPADELVSEVLAKTRALAERDS